MASIDDIQKSQDKLRSRIPGVNGDKALEFMEEAQQLMDAASYEQRPFIGQRRLNLRYFLGDQWLMLNNTQWPVTTRRGFNEQLPLATDNILNGMLRGRVSKVVSAVPSFEAVPVSSEQVSVWRAKQATRYARAYWYYLNLIPLWRDALLMAGIYDTSFAEVYWNRNGGRLVRGKREGEVGIRLLPPTQVLVDPNADRVMSEPTGESDAQWLFVCTEVTLDELQAGAKEMGELPSAAGNFIVRGGLPDDDDIAPADSKSVSYEDRAVRTGGGLQLDHQPVVRLRNGKLNPLTKIRVFRFFQQPNDEYPAGRYAVVMPDTGNYVLEYRDELPYATKELPGLFPFVQFWDVKVPGRLAGHSRFQDARADQDTINIRRTSLNQMMAVYFPTLFVDRRWGGIDLDAMTRNNRVGNVVPFDSGAAGEKPFMFWPAEIQGYCQQVMAEIDKLKLSAQNKMDSHDTWDATPRRATATGEQLAQQEDEDRLSNGDVLIAEQLGEAPATKLILQMIKRRYDREREIRFLGDRRRTEIVKVRAEDIEFSDIQLAPGTTSRRNQANVRADLMTLVQYGLYTSKDEKRAEELRQYVLERMNFEAGEDSNPDEDDYRNAWNENLEMLEGHDVLSPSPGDNPVIHVREHRHFLKTAEFQNLDNSMKKTVYRLVEAHCLLHGFQLNQAIEDTSPDAAAPMIQGAEPNDTSPQAAPLNPQQPIQQVNLDGSLAGQQEQENVAKSRNLLGAGA